MLISSSHSNNQPRTGKALPVRWRILAILFVISFVAYLFRLNLSVAGLSIMEDLNLSETQLSLILSTFIWGYTLFQFPGGLLGLKYGPRLVLSVTVVAWAALTLLSGALPGTLLTTSGAVVVSLMVLRFLMGVAQAPLFPLMSGSIVAWFPQGRWALPNSICSVGATLGFSLTSILIAWMVERYGWQASFYLTAPVGLLASALWWYYSRNSPAEHAAVGEAELALINRGREPAPAEKIPPGLLTHVLKNRNVLLLTSAYLCMNYVWYIYFSWLFIYLVKERGFSLLESGFLAALPWIAGSVAVALGGGLCDRLCAKLGARWGCRIPAMTGLVMVSLLLVLAAYAVNPYLAVGLFTACYAFNQFTEGAFWQGATFVGGPYTSAVTGVLNTGGNLAGVIATPLTAVLFQQFGWFVALATGSAFALCGAILWLVIRVDRPLRPR